MAFMVFNPNATTPSVDMPALSERRFLTGFASQDGANNDWLIIPAGSGAFSFNAASLTNTLQEKMKLVHQ